MTDDLEAKAYEALLRDFLLIKELARQKTLECEAIKLERDVLQARVNELEAKK